MKPHLLRWTLVACALAWTRAAGVPAALDYTVEVAEILSAPAGKKTYMRLIVISLVMYIAIAALHAWLGVNPFT